MDIETLRLLAAGDKSALEQCLLFVAQWSARQWLSREDVEDIAAETAFRAAANVDRYRGDAEVGTWIIGIAKNVCREHFRHRARKAPPAESLEENPVAVEDGVDVEDMVLMRLLLDEALEALTEAEREAFLLSEREGLSSKQVGERMGKSANAVRCLKSSAAKKLGQHCREFLE